MIIKGVINIWVGCDFKYGWDWWETCLGLDIQQVDAIEFPLLNL